MHPEKHCSLPGTESSPRTASPVRPTQSQNSEVRIHQMPRTYRDERGRRTGRDDPQPTRNERVRPDGRIKRWDRSKLMLAVCACGMRPPRLIKRNEETPLVYFTTSKDSSTLSELPHTNPSACSTSIPTSTITNPNTIQPTSCQPTNHTVATHTVSTHDLQGPRLRKSTPYSHYLTATPIAEVLWRCLILK